MTLESLIMCNVHVTHQILLQTPTYEPIQCSKNKPVVRVLINYKIKHTEFKKYLNSSLCTLALPLLALCFLIRYLAERSCIFFTKHACLIECTKMQRVWRMNQECGLK